MTGNSVLWVLLFCVIFYIGVKCILKEYKGDDPYGYRYEYILDYGLLIVVVIILLQRLI